MMKNWTKRLLVLVLVACALLQTTAVAAEVYGPGETQVVPLVEDTEPEATEPEETEPEATEPEKDPLEGFTFPNNWAGEPLRFAVRYGILKGRGDYDLDPTGYTTRAEMGAMLVRLLGGTEEGDVSRFTDLNPKAWYYKEMSVAVELGIFTGTTETTMEPQRRINRQEAFTVLARAFGIYPKDPTAYTHFKDGAQVQPFARDAVSALYEIGCVNGYETGYLKPRAYISRQEVASLFYRLLDVICDTPEALPDSGNVLYRGTEPLPEGYFLDGSLFLGAGLSGDISLGACQVTEKLVLRCAGGAQVHGEGAQAQELCVATGMTVTGGNFPRVTVSGKDSVLELSGQQGAIYAPCTLDGDFGTVGQYAPGVTYLGDLGELYMGRKSGDGTTEVDGQVDAIVVEGDNTVLDGAGYAETITVRGRDCRILLSCGDLVDEVDRGLDGVTMTLTGPQQVTYSGNQVQIDARFRSTYQGYHAEEGRMATLRWYLDGALVSTQENFCVKDGAFASLTYTFDRNNPPETNPVFRAVLTRDDDTVEGSFTVQVDSGAWKYHRDYKNALEIVETVNIEGEVLKDTKLYSDKYRSDVIKTVPKGAKVTHLYFSSDTSTPGNVRLEDGTVGWMDWSDYLVSREDYTQYYDYSLGAKEGFVNQMGYSSTTDYLIWVNLKTQKVNIFEGSKGDWELIRSSPCATGKNTTPTFSGVHTLIYKTWRWRFDGYDTDGSVIENMTKVYNVSGFWGGQAFHSREYYYDDSIYNGTMGTPVSHGCVRMMDEDCAYIYDNMPFGTTVVIY